MKPVIKIVPYGALPCEAKDFSINGIKAEKDDFGHNSNVGSFDYDYGPSDDENWACADNQFIRNENIPGEVLEKYNITADEYRAIQDRLASVFNVGSCGWCV